MEAGQRMWKSSMGSIIKSSLLVGVTSAELASTVNTRLAQSSLWYMGVLESLEPKGIEFSLCRLSSR